MDDPSSSGTREIPIVLHPVDRAIPGLRSTVGNNRIGVSPIFYLKTKTIHPSKHGIF